MLDDLEKFVSPRQIKRLVAKSENGLVYGNFKKGGSEDQKISLELNFYSFMVPNNSRSLGTYEIARLDEQCQ